MGSRELSARADEVQERIALLRAASPQLLAEILTEALGLPLHALSTLRRPIVQLFLLRLEKGKAREAVALHRHPAMRCREFDALRRMLQWHDPDHLEIDARVLRVLAQGF